MSKSRSYLGRALGLIEVVVAAVKAEIRQHGEKIILDIPDVIVKRLTKEYVNSLARTSGLIKQFATPKLLGQLNSPDNCYEVSIDYDLSLDEMVEAGDYDDYNVADINSFCFTICGSGRRKVVVRLINFGVILGDREARDRFLALGVRGAKLEELLALGAEYKEKQREFTIVALGSMFVDTRRRDSFVPYIFEYNMSRKLDTAPCSEKFGDHVYYAVVALEE